MIELPMSSTVMMSAAVRSSFLAFRMRPAGSAGSSPGSPFTSGITATPVSKPDRPSASFGNTIRAAASIITGLPCACTSPSRHLGKYSG